MELVTRKGSFVLLLPAASTSLFPELLKCRCLALVFSALPTAPSPCPFFVYVAALWFLASPQPFLDLSFLIEESLAQPQTVAARGESRGLPRTHPFFLTPV